MRNRTKPSRIILRTLQIISQLLYIEEEIRNIHLKEKIHEEHVTVSKIQVVPKHFFRYVKRYSIYKQEVGPLLNPLNNTLTDNTYKMCYLLANKFNSMFTKPKQTSVIEVPVTFVLSHATTTRDDGLFLTNIILYLSQSLLNQLRNFPQTLQVVLMASLLLFRLIVTKSLPPFCIY